LSTMLAAQFLFGRLRYPGKQEAPAPEGAGATVDLPRRGGRKINRLQNTVCLWLGQQMANTKIYRFLWNDFSDKIVVKRHSYKARLLRQKPRPTERHIYETGNSGHLANRVAVSLGRSFKNR
jgi:hypothetical protein